MTVLTLSRPSASRDEPPWQLNYHLLWSGSALSMLGGMSASVAGPLVALNLSGSAVAAGWVVAAGTIPHLFFQIPAGLIADRVDRRRIMLACQIVRLLVATGTVILLLLGELSLPLLLLAVVISGTCLTFHGIAEVGALPIIVPPRRLVRAMAKNEARTHLALLLGRPLGGFLYGLDRFFPFLADAVLCLISVLTIGLIRTKRMRPARPRSGHVESAWSLVRDVHLGMSWLWRYRFMRTAMLVCIITNFLFQAIVLLLVVISKEQGLSSLVIGVLLAAPGVGGLLGTFVAPALLRHLESSTVIRACVWAWFALTAVIALSPHPIVWFLAWGGVGFMGAQMNVAITIHQAELMPTWVLGRVISATRFLTMGTVPFGTVISGYGISLVGPTHVALLVSVSIGALAMAITMARRSMLALNPATPVARQALTTGGDRSAQAGTVRIIIGEVVESEPGQESPRLDQVFDPADRRFQNTRRENFAAFTSSGEAAGSSPDAVPDSPATIDESLAPDAGSPLPLEREFAGGKT